MCDKMCVELKNVAIIYNFLMKKKYLIFGATGSIGSSLANQMYKEKKDCHLIGRNNEEIAKLANKLSSFLMVPYLMWLSYAFVLNFYIFILN